MLGSPLSAQSWCLLFKPFWSLSWSRPKTHSSFAEMWSEWWIPQARRRYYSKMTPSDTSMIVGSKSMMWHTMISLRSLFKDRINRLNHLHKEILDQDQTVDFLMKMMTRMKAQDQDRIAHHHHQKTVHIIRHIMTNGMTIALMLT